MFRPKRQVSDFSAEIQAHIQMETERLREQGLSEADAQAAARRAFGNLMQAEERFYESGRWLWFDYLRQDLRFAFRMLRKSPGFAAVAVATLAVAIGANAVVFSALDAFLLRPLNVPQSESLYGLQFGGGHRGALSYPNYMDFRDRNRSFDGLAMYQMTRVGLDTGRNPTRAWLYEVSGNYFDVLKIQPYLGRFFHASDEHGAGSAPYIVLSDSYWHGQFQDDPGVVGSRVRVNKRPYTIIGVAPPEFRGTFLLLSPDFFVP
ncbi:MAG TPA: ABC transporter permease, partial [Candidatus Dormibacteraeota bacterium]|nr:ABC transporter permease [Candidatus Dormibacteraeota bacterium]